MASSEKRNAKSVKDGISDPMNNWTEGQLPKLQQASAEPGKAYLTGTSFDSAGSRSQSTDSNMSPFDSLPADLEVENAFAFYPSGGDPSESPRPTLADAVIEHLRQARMRRQRPH
jgi:hypothetical protein